MISLTTLLAFYAFLFGTLIGSFTNVIIYRMPQDLDIVFQRSHCRNCKTLIKWYQNIPLFSYLFLRGKCANCQCKIAPQYPLIELICGIAAYCLFPNYLSSHTFALFCFYFSTFVVLLAHFVIDLRHQILPNKLNFYLLLTFSFYAFAYLSWRDSLLGLIVGLVIPALVTWVFYMIRGEVGLGGGDIKLFAILGILVGPLGVIQNIFASCFLGSIVGGTIIVLRKLDSKKPIPFGPFIITIAFFQIYFPESTEELFSFFYR